MAAPLQGIKVLEFAGLAPGPFAGMLLADCGATVLRIDRPGSEVAAATDMLARRKSSMTVDIGTEGGAALIRALVARAGIDVLIDPYRPGVLEKKGLGPDSLRKLRPQLVFARLSGFRRTGRYKDMAGHDINYLAVSGLLNALGRADEKPYPPLNLVADFAGGGATLVLGVLLALLHRSRTGSGQVVEANMVDGAGYLGTFSRISRKMPPPLGGSDRGRNLLDGGCPFYDTYETSDGLYMSVGAIEWRFFSDLVRLLGLSGWDDDETRMDRKAWPRLRAEMEAAFRSRDRKHWETVFDGSDACCVPVLDFQELETDARREGFLSPVVDLHQSPLIPPAPTAHTCVVPRPGYDHVPLSLDTGGQELVREWLGWESGKQYHRLEHGGFVLDSGFSSHL
ncbi:hypothetical protein L249_4842 [Ophiocordyceps polyrhachis-furcata BCC 54312]|uniref:Alpha-methylacyl-CoA racemase n=1 Tax=Ophiocordyceps polyrhachis-furcata BCC 54312 TaxID=1330021 RepID=A0A367L3N4_9HYPO|nr:hypothetical protein L249_4842 [Ophiocordyceps polyrhachis-furcata BCC 54312]